MNKNIEQILALINEKNGRTTTKEITEHGFRREYLSEMVEEKLLIREARGIYRVPDTEPDFLAVIQKSCPKAVFSHTTAFSILESADFSKDNSKEISKEIHITVQQGFNMTRLKHKYPKLMIHYVQADDLEYGINEINSSSGYSIRVYDLDRTICDLIRYKSHMNPEEFANCIRRYFQSKQKDLRNLQTYAHHFSVEEKVLNYMEVLM